MADRPAFPAVLSLSILGETKEFQMVDSSTIVNVTNLPAPGDGRIVLGIAHQQRPRGLAIPMQVPEALQLINTLTRAVRDDRRLRAGLEPAGPPSEVRFEPGQGDDVVVPNLVEQQWILFEAAALPAEAPEIQRAEMKLAFFGGYKSFMTVLEAMLDPESEPTDRDQRQMAAVEAELDGFAQSLAADAAAGCDDTRH